MPTILTYMRGHPTRALSMEMVKNLIGTARRPGKLAPVAHFMTASHTEILDELFETELPKGALAAMAAFQRMEADMTAAVAIIYLGVVQRIANAMPIGGTVELPRALPAASRPTAGASAPRPGSRRSPSPARAPPASGSRRARRSTPARA